MLEPRALTRLVLADGWTVAGTIATVSPEEIEQAIGAHENLVPLIRVEPQMNAEIEGSFCAELRKWLKPIGMSNWPEANWDRSEWLNASLLALSDLPPKVAIAATRRAIHLDFRFPNEVKPAIRKIADEIMTHNKLALHRLRMMRDEIQRALNHPQPQIEAQPMIWTQADVDKWNETFIKLGLTIRYRLNGDDVENYEIGSSDIDADEITADRSN